MTTALLPLRTRRTTHGEYDLLDGSRIVGTVRRIPALGGQWRVSLGGACPLFSSLVAALAWVDEVTGARS